VLVTEDAGGVRGLRRARNQLLLFWSSHHFGFFSIVHMDLDSPPCAGWSSSIFDIAVDHASSSGRLLLSLSDGDLLAVSTRSSTQASLCELTAKFPKVSTLPFELTVVRGHVMGLTTPPRREAKAEGGHLRELIFFNLAAMELGPALPNAPRVVSMEVNFKPQQPMDIDAYVRLSAGSERSKVQLVVRMHGSTGLDIYDLSLKGPKGAGHSTSHTADILEQAPKAAVLIIILLVTVLWNVHKAKKQQARAERLKKSTEGDESGKDTSTSKEEGGQDETLPPEQEEEEAQQREAPDVQEDVLESDEEPHISEVGEDDDDDAA